MDLASVSESEGRCIVSLEIYPNPRLGDALCKLSDDGKAFKVPTGNMPLAPWEWRFDPSFKPALLKLLQKHELEIRS